ncbi:MAG: HAD family phosphatase [Candidatus Uhrbacteria bacterium]|nr:HAD family phosphatase [Candidatus Uhrbacteria bacterium]
MNEVKINISNIKAVIFDMDGLMFNSELVYRAALEEMAKRRGRIFTDAIHRSMMGKAAIEDIRVLLNAWNLKEDPREAFIERNDLYISLVDHLLKPMPGLIELLDTIKNKELRMAIATGSERRIVDINLSTYKLDFGYFELIISGDGIKNGKPDPEIYNKTVQLLALKPIECLVIEDSLNGVIAAKATGCKAFAVPNQWSDPKDFNMADNVFASLEQIIPVILGI